MIDKLFQMNKLPKYLIYTICFIAVAAIIAAVQYHIFGIPYAAKEEVRIIVFAEVLLCLIPIYYAKRYSSWKQIGFGKTNWRKGLWIAPLLVLVLIHTFDFIRGVAATNPSSVEVFWVMITLIETFWIGVAEETMFRGVLLRGALTRYNIFGAMLISAIGFSLLHSINVLAGYPVPDTISQLIVTFQYGLLMAPLALLVGNLWPLILAHFLWDFTGLAKVQLSAPITGGAFYGITGLVIPSIQLLYIMVLWGVIYLKWRKGKLIS